MKKRSGFGFVHSAAAVAIAFGAIGQAQAVGYCNTNSASNASALPAGSVDASNGLAVSDVKFNGVNSENCYGVVDGNDTGSQAFDINGANLFGQQDWTYLTKSDGAPIGTFTVGSSTYNFSLTANNGSQQGGWTLTVGPSGNTFPIWLDFVVTLKATNGFGAYLFDDTEVNQANNGTFSVKFGNGNNFAELSHMSLFVRQGTGGGGGGGGGNVPEPVSLALVGAALLGARLATRRRS